MPPMEAADMCSEYASPAWHSRGTTVSDAGVTGPVPGVATVGAEGRDGAPRVARPVQAPVRAANPCTGTDRRYCRRGADRGRHRPAQTYTRRPPGRSCPPRETETLA